VHILVIGLNHNSAPLEMRELLAFSVEEQERGLSILLKSHEVYEVAYLATCNRTEVYAAVGEFNLAERHILETIAKQAHLTVEELLPHVYIHRNSMAAYHLFKVASGLDSMILGETQILGQVKEAYGVATNAGSVGKYLHELFNRALAVAKRVHSETAISQNAVSVSYAAVELTKKVFGTLREQRVLLIGAGETAEITAHNLREQGVAGITVVNRTLEKAERLAAKYHGSAGSLTDLMRWLRVADIVISSTGSSEYILTAEQLKAVMRQRKQRPLFLIDIAVPRDIDPAGEAIDHLFLYDIDDLKNVVEANLKQRQREARRAEKILFSEQEAYKQWLNSQVAIPVIKELRHEAEALRKLELDKALNRLGTLSEKDQDTVIAMSSMLVNKILNEPTQKLKTMGNSEYAAIYMAVASTLFGLDQEKSVDSLDRLVKREVERIAIQKETGHARELDSKASTDVEPIIHR